MEAETSSQHEEDSLELWQVEIYTPLSSFELSQILLGEESPLEITIDEEKEIDFEVRGTKEGIGGLICSYNKNNGNSYVNRKGESILHRWGLVPIRSEMWTDSEVYDAETFIP